MLDKEQVGQPTNLHSQRCQRSGAAPVSSWDPASTPHWHPPGSLRTCVGRTGAILVPYNGYINTVLLV